MLCFWNWAFNVLSSFEAEEESSLEADEKISLDAKEANSLEERRKAL
jgi:hypothetical protein